MGIIHTGKLYLVVPRYSNKYSFSPTAQGTFHQELEIHGYLILFSSRNTSTKWWKINYLLFYNIKCDEQLVVKHEMQHFLSKIIVVVHKNFEKYLRCFKNYEKYFEGAQKLRKMFKNYEKYLKMRFIYYVYGHF